MSDNLKVASEPDAYLCLDDSGKPYACKLTIEAGEKHLPLYTYRTLASQQAAHEEEIARLQTQVAMLHDVLARTSQEFRCGVHLTATSALRTEALINTQATAEQFIAECEQRGAVKALEEVMVQRDVRNVSTLRCIEQMIEEYRAT